jgi:phosphoserine aminotransferase
MVYNFAAGPSALPTEVMSQIQEEFLTFADAKASVMEISHRSTQFMEIYHQMQSDLRELMQIPNNYQILFTHGGASLQFSAIPLNLAKNGVANYVLTGHWSEKAIIEGQRQIKVNIATDNKENNFTNIADFNTWQIDESADYLHYCTNETIAGLEFDFIPKVDMPLIADMSSNILSKEIDVSKFGVIYAGAQKNIGAAGFALVIVREDLIGNAKANTPRLLDYATYAQNDSMFNTPTTFAWYSAYKVFKWLKTQGIENIYQNNHKKAKILYDFIDKSDYYSNPVNLKYRSQMNVPFILKDDNLNQLFLDESFDANLLALKGHKSVGGMRASIYNSMPIAGVQALISFMSDFENKYG